MYATKQNNLSSPLSIKLQQQFIVANYIEKTDFLWDNKYYCMGEDSYVHSSAST